MALLSVNGGSKLRTAGSFFPQYSNQNKQQQEIISQIDYYMFNKSSKENIKVFENALSAIFTEPFKFLDTLDEKKIDNKSNLSDFYKNRLAKEFYKE